MFHELTLTVRDSSSWVFAKLLPPASATDTTGSVPVEGAAGKDARHEKDFYALFEALMSVVHRFPGLSKEIDTVLLQFQKAEVRS